MTLSVRIKPRAQRAIERAAEWWSINRLAAPGAVRMDVEAALALLIQEPGITEYQSEAARRLHLPFPLVSDARLDFARALRLPTFAFAGSELIKRLTMIARAGRMEEVLYPVFPSDADAGRVIEWLSSRSSGRAR